MPLIKINDREIEAEAGSKLLQIALDNGFEIPHYCYHPRLSIAGSCRLCQVEVEGMRGTQVSCNVTINSLPDEKKVDGVYDMVVRTETEEIRDARRRALELLLLNHPLDCPVCDQAGECFLQDYAFAHGYAHSRFGEAKRVNPKKRLGPEVWIYPNRCVLCSRCTRFCEEVVGEPQLIIRNRGYNSLIDVRDGKLLDNLMSGNTVDICPVGSLVSADFLHKTRVWNLEGYDSVCNDCSVGCNVQIHVKDNAIQRIKPRLNEDVNDYWMCDIGRLSYHSFEEIERLASPMVRDGDDFKAVSWEAVFGIIREKFGVKGKASGVVGSAYMTNEENYLLGKIASKGLKNPENVGIYPGQMEGDPVIFKSGFRISPDRTPNRCGAQQMLGVRRSSVLENLKSRKVSSLYFLHGGTNDLLSENDARVLKNLNFLIVQSLYMSDTAKLADVVLPACYFAEKAGTLTSDMRRVQRMFPALEPPAGVMQDWEVIARVGEGLGMKNMKYESVTGITAEIAENVAGYAGCTFHAVGPKGKVKQKDAAQPSGAES